MAGKHALHNIYSYNTNILTPSLPLTLSGSLSPTLLSCSHSLSSHGKQQRPDLRHKDVGLHPEKNLEGDREWSMGLSGREREKQKYGELLVHVKPGDLS